MENRKLLDYILQNKELRFLDPDRDQSFQVNDFLNTIELNQRKTLAFLYLDNRIRSIEVLLNFLNSDHVLVPLSPTLNTALKSQLENTYQPGYIYDPSEREIPEYEEVYKGIFLSKIQFNHQLHPELKYLLSTSGTTGSPKLVKLSEKNILSNALSIVQYLPVCKDDVVPLNLRLFYSYGLSVFTSNAIAGGKILCSTKDILQKEFWEDFGKYECTSLAGVPFSYEILNRIGFCSSKYPYLRYLTQAGGKLSETLIRTFEQYTQENNMQFFVMYGQTEATARMSYLPPQDIQRKTGSIGKAISGGSFSLDPETGELLYQGPNIFGGYARCPDDLKTFHSPDFLHTGDIARRDEDGYYYITGRLKRFVKLSGYRINLDEIENFLKSELTDTRLACQGIGDKFLYIVHTNPDLEENTIKQLLSHKLQIHPRTVRVCYMDSIPMTANGKNDYQAIESSID